MHLHDFLLQTYWLYLHSFLLQFMIALTTVGMIVLTSRYVGKISTQNINRKKAKLGIMGEKYPLIPIAIWCLIMSTIIDQFEIIENLPLSLEVSKTLANIGLSMLSVSMFQIGLEAVDFSLLTNPRYWRFISAITTMAGIISWGLVDKGACSLQSFGNGLLLFTSSLAVVAVFVQRKPELFHHPLTKAVMITGITTDILLWVGIGILSALNETQAEGSVAETIFWQVLVISISIAVVVWGKMQWWEKAPKVPSWVWLVGSLVVALAFYGVKLSPVLGAIFGGMMVPERDKHRVSKELTPVFTITMQIYMATVGFKVHELLSLQAFEIALGFICITTIGKGVAIFFFGKSIFSQGKFIQTLVLLGNGGTMLIAAAGALEHAHVIEAVVFDATIIVAIFYTLLAGYILERNPIQIKEEYEESLWALPLVMQVWYLIQKHKKQSILFALMFFISTYKNRREVEKNPLYILN